MNWLKRIIHNRTRDRKELPQGVFCNAVPLPSADAGEGDGYIRIVPVGDFPGHWQGGYSVTSEHVQQMADNFAASSIDLMFDVDHESWWGGSTRAAGWSADVQARPDGLYIKYPDWTPSGEQLIANREYRYLSPTFSLESFDAQGQPTGAELHSVALTNQPFYRRGEIGAIGNSQETPSPDPQDFMKREDLIKLLGLADDATDDQINEALAQGQAALADKAAAEAGAETQTAETGEGGPEGTSADDIEARVNAAVDKRVAEELARRDAAGRAEALVNQAVADFKIRKADADVYLNSAKLDFDATKAKLDAIRANSVRPTRVLTNSSDQPARSGLAASVSKEALAYVEGSK